ncbi:MAG: LPXTG cell wall anchor domain-containing protein [Acidobacteriota bacterium]|nr:LPXTG cell wall anchor domain-containing protein [Acidobacteriota bacterium]
MDSTILVRVLAGALAIIVVAVIVYRRKQKN